MKEDRKLIFLKLNAVALEPSGNFDFFLLNSLLPTNMMNCHVLHSV